MNCLHLLPVLGALEQERVGQPLAIIGVHSAKFDAEKGLAHIQAAVERNGIDHPVVVDSDMAIWNRYGVQSWPTLVLIRPDGRIAGAIPGEIPLATLDAAVQRIMDDARRDGTLAGVQLLPPRPRASAPSALSYPGKVLAAADGRIFVSDSGHHRVLILDRDGAIQDTVGSGEPGHAPGAFGTARLDDPQGLALDAAQNVLYIADARGQLLWRADLGRRTLAVLAGDGALGQAPFGSPRPALAQELRTPWDLALSGSDLFIAMAGSHQLCRLDLQTGLLGRFAGSGRESLDDGGPRTAAFAQPSGLAREGGTLFVADSESSAVRAVDLRSGETRTVVGTGLFDWGDGDGPLAPRLLQHPLAVAASPGGLWVADSYNGKIKRFSPDMSSLTTVLSAAEGRRLGDPAGLAVEPDGSLLIADTDGARLLRLPPGGGEARVVPVHQLAALVREPGPTRRALPGAQTPIHELPPRRLAPGLRTVALAIVAPDGFAFSEGSPWSIALDSDGPGLTLTSTAAQGEARAGVRIDVPIPGARATADGRLLADVRANVCDAIHHAACYPLRQRFGLPLTLGATEDGAEAPFELPLLAPAIPAAGGR